MSEASSRLQNEVSSSFAEAIDYRHTWDGMGHDFGGVFEAYNGEEIRRAKLGW